MTLLDHTEITDVSGGIPAPEVLLAFGFYQDYLRFTENPLPLYYRHESSNDTNLIP